MNLVERVKNIIVSPKAEWPVIAGETESIADIYKGYILILAAIGPVAGIIGMSVVGINIGFGTWRVPIFSAVASAVVQYILTLVSVYVMALIIDALAPSFGGEKNPDRAFKVAAFSMTPSWLAGIFAVVPMLAILGLVGLYSLYLLYLGLPELMKAPKEKALGYTVTVVIAGVVMFLVIGMAGRLFISGPSFTMQ
jgi:sterol desaturase/sphingolipid hydroxylase (fatty acid hydroxylase superfamily)